MFPLLMYLSVIINNNNIVTGITITMRYKKSKIIVVLSKQDRILEKLAESQLHATLGRCGGWRRISAVKWSLPGEFPPVCDICFFESTYPPVRDALD